MMERLEGAFGSAEQLLHSLLDISRLETTDPDTVSPTEVSLATIIAGIQGDQTLVAENKNVRLDVVPCSEIVKSDPVYLLRSIQNLVVNAIQYTEPGGRVLVGCRRRGDKVILQVWDTGIGIARKDQERVFEEFTRAENVPLGSGMGLGFVCSRPRLPTFGPQAFASIQTPHWFGVQHRNGQGRNREKRRRTVGPSGQYGRCAVGFHHSGDRKRP